MIDPTFNTVRSKSVKGYQTNNNRNVRSTNYYSSFEGWRFLSSDFTPPFQNDFEHAKQWNLEENVIVESPNYQDNFTHEQGWSSPRHKRSSNRRRNHENDCRKPQGSQSCSLNCITITQDDHAWHSTEKGSSFFRSDYEQPQSRQLLSSSCISNHQEDGTKIIRWNDRKPRSKKRKNTCLNPIPRAGECVWWQNVHNNFLVSIRQHDYDVAMVGDCLIGELEQSAMWEYTFQKLNLINLGVRCDRVENVLYRLKNGEIDNDSIKIVVLMIGTNNYTQKSWEIFEGIVECVDTIHRRLPEAAVILPTLIPMGKTSEDQHRFRINGVNQHIMGMARKGHRRRPLNFKAVHVVPIHGNIIQEDGCIPDHILDDYIHPTEYGYPLIFMPIFIKICALLR